ncbi:transmembrane protein 265-like [Clinocottus analis]|uniref:transmembrane protein 265-like n=1 Tax=Clinocottus analis TaxID=304258 RepID=UPI0035C1C9EA
MSTSPPVREAADEVSILLTTVPGAGEVQTSKAINSAGPGSSCCDDQHHRKLAICSIVCGISCIGIKALINSVKAEKTADPERAEAFTKQAKKFGIISIVVWVSLLVLTPVLFALVSYLLTLGD